MAPIIHHFSCFVALVLCSTVASGFVTPKCALQGLLPARGCVSARREAALEPVAGLRPCRRQRLHVLAYSVGSSPEGAKGGNPDPADPATVNFADGLREHLAGIWGPTGGEDFSLYSPDVEFKDPLASFRGIERYRQMLRMLKDSKISSGVQFQTHDVSIAGKGNVRARWFVFSLHSYGAQHAGPAFVIIFLLA